MSEPGRGRGTLLTIAIEVMRQSCTEARIFEAVVVQGVSIKKDSVLTVKLSFKDICER